MMTGIDTIALAQRLVRIDTAGPEAREQTAVDLIAPILATAGFAVTMHAFAPSRPSLIARLEHPAGGLPLLFSGHLDTVPVGASAWRRDPLGAVIEGGYLHGRGSADMKAGVAAMVAALVGVAETGTAKRPLVLVLTAAEEIGCLGADHLRTHGLLPRAAGIVVAEPTDNRVALGHRGALWLRATYAGRSAHGAQPQLGVNAIYAAAVGILRCEAVLFDDVDPLLGRVSVNVGTMRGGLNLNSVPDQADFTIDIRSTVPGSHGELRQAVIRLLGPDATLDTLLDLPAVRTRSTTAFAREVLASAAAAGLAIEPTIVPFFTDASILVDACKADAVIVGPGSPRVAHQTDESCSVAQIEAAADLYRGLAARPPTTDLAP